MQKILVVDDNPENIYLLDVLLKSKGFEVMTAANGVEALESAHSSKPDLIISDILMPVMDGFVLCRKCKTDDLLNDVPFVFYTASYSGPKDEEFAASLGADRFILKPQEPETLLHLLAEFVGDDYKAKPSSAKPLGEEMEFFRRHNEILFSKLEKKMLDLEIANQKLKTEEEALRKKEEFLTSIIENIPDMIFVKEAETLRFVRVNRAGEELLGHTREELIGRNDYDFFPRSQADSFIEKDRQVLDGGRLIDIPEERIETAELGERILHTKKLPIVQREGKAGYLLGISEDITRRRLAEKELTTIMDKLKRSLIGTIQSMSHTVETRDPYTAGHQKRVADLAAAIAGEMGLSADRVGIIRMAGMIHDIGKLSVPAEILSKPTQLTDIELSLIKIHPQSGYDILKDAELPYPLAEIVLQHHERPDGSGYPRGLRNGQILLEAQIVAVADVVEAISSHRPYRPAKGIGTALEEIERNAGRLYNQEPAEVCVRLFRKKGYVFEQ